MAAHILSAKKRFESKFIPEPNSGCWIWLCGRNKWGYGQFWFGRSNMQAHRFAYQLWRGPTPKGLVVMHKCDNRLCVNPDHLHLGTYKDNSEDMVRKGRSASGDRNSRRLYPNTVLRGQQVGTSKYTEQQAREILQSSLSHKEIAQKLGVGYHTVWKIRRGIQWGHIR